MSSMAVALGLTSYHDCTNVRTLHGLQLWAAWIQVHPSPTPLYQPIRLIHALVAVEVGGVYGLNLIKYVCVPRRSWWLHAVRSFRHLCK